jgi:hypothetical protein
MQRNDDGYMLIEIIGILVTISIPGLLGFPALASDGLIPEIELGNAKDDSIRIVLGDVNPDDDNQVLLYARSASGRWIGLKPVAIGAGSGRFTCSGDEEADMTLVDCNGSQW